MEHAGNRKQPTLNRFNRELFAERVRSRRGERTLRDVAGELELGIATLSRIENRKLPDVETFARLCQWMGDNPAIYLYPDDPAAEDAVTVQLRAAQAMSMGTSAALMELARAFYAEVLTQAHDEDKA